MEKELQRAVHLAYGALSKRERTESELRTLLERRRVDPAAIDGAVVELREAGQIDDAAYARRFAEDKQSLARWGSERIARDLQRRGVAPALVEEALAGRGRDGELSDALSLLAERHPLPPRSDRERDRAWSLLVRRGYDTDLAYEAVRAHERAGRDAA